MDPSQALRDADAHLRAGDLAGAAGCLAHYRAWRRGGGFEPPGGDPRARELGRRLVAPASPVRTTASCGWCHAMNAVAERFCKECGHEAHVSRMDCRCPRCTRGAEPVTEEDIEAVLAELRRRHGAGVTGGPAPPSRPTGQAPGDPSCLCPREQNDDP